MDREFTDAAIEEIKQFMHTDLPPHQWTSEQSVSKEQHAQAKVLPEVYDQPRLRAAIEEMFNPAESWDGQPKFTVFFKPYEPDAEAQLSPVGHIDFVQCQIPVFGSGCMFQISLVNSEPFGGNISIFPGTHTLIQKQIMDNPDVRYPAIMDAIPDVEPYEFVAEPGDVLFFHHLANHAGNANHCAGRSPRLALHCQALRETWLTAVDPANPNISPWERSMATNGAFALPYDEREMLETHYGLR